MNRVILIGNLGHKPEVKKAKSGLSVCNLSVATNERVKKGDSWEDHTEWHRVVVFGSQADNCEKYLDKGSTVAVEGRNRTSSYQDKDGNDRKSTEVIADKVKFIGGKDNGASSQPNRQPASQPTADDIPF